MSPLDAAEAVLSSVHARRRAAEEEERAARAALRDIQRTLPLPAGWVWEKDVGLVDDAPAVQVVEVTTGRRGQWDGHRWYSGRVQEQPTPPWEWE